MDDDEIKKNIDGFCGDIHQFALDRDWVSAKRLARALHKALIAMEISEYAINRKNGDEGR